MPSVISGDANVSATEFGYLDGVTSALQTQIDGKLAAGVGRILQVVQGVKTDVFSSASQGTWTDVTGWSASITPSSASNKVLVLFTTSTTATGDLYTGFRVVRGSTAVGLGDASGSRVAATAAQRNGSNDSQQVCGIFLDSPNTTSSTTYKIQINNHTNSQTLRIGAGLNDLDNVATYKSITTITLMEVSG